MKFLFPDINKENKAYKEMSMNIVANLLGLGNAATPLGLKAIKTLQEENSNKEELSDSMIMFITTYSNYCNCNKNLTSVRAILLKLYCLFG